MKTLALKAKSRTELKKSVSTLREKGEVPAVLYGHKVKNINLAVSRSEFVKIYTAAGESTLVDLAIDSAAPVKVIIQDAQFDPTRGDCIHVDFHQVNMKEKLHTSIKLVFTGEAPAVKSEGGILVTNKTALNVSCLPQDLMSEIEVKIDSLMKINDAIRVKDIKIPAAIEILDNADDIVVTVVEIKAEVEPVVAPTAAEPEVIGKKEEAEAATDAKAGEKKDDKK